MKKLLAFAAIATLSASTFAAPFSTSELKEMDCATLAVEKANAERALKNAATPSGKLKKFAGFASKTLNSFGGDSEKAAKASNVANNIAGEESMSAEDAQANIENISTYQKGKNCKI